MEKRFCWPVSPVALPENTIIGDKYRFTMLLPGLIRMEYAPDGIFEDRASQTAFYRDFPKCDFTYQKDKYTFYQGIKEELTTLSKQYQLLMKKSKNQNLKPFLFMTISRAIYTT